MDNNIKKIKAFLIISRFNEDISWINNYTSNYIIYNKGENLPETYKQKMVPNFGGNQYDIFNYIYTNYNKLPNLIAFMQGNPFDHCLPERFDQLIYNESYTHLFGDINYPHGEYFESNNNWYIDASFNGHKPPSKFSSFDEYMHHMFEDYTPLSTLYFPPGSQLIVEKERCLFYSKEFWKKLMEVIRIEWGINGGREAHIVERSIQLIFENKYKEKHNGTTKN
jgi:hypothetical protein